MFKVYIYQVLFLQMSLFCSYMNETHESSDLITKPKLLF